MTDLAEGDVIAQVSQILADAGFKPMPEGVLEGVFIRPNGSGNYVFGGVHEAAGEVHAWDPGLNANTTNDPVEAAQNLAAYIRAKLGPSEPLAAAIELAEDSAHESNGETGEGSGVASQGDDSTDAGDAERVDLFDADPGSAGSGVVRGEGEAWEPNAEHSPDDAIFDAIFDDAPDLGSELLDDEAFAVPELEAPPPEDFAPDEIEPEPEHAAGAFIFGDNLAHDRIIRIGQLSEHANTLIDAAKVGYSDAEHIFVHSHVVTNMNEAGAYVGGRQDLFDRFIELEAVTSRIRRIEMHRDERQDFIRSADREAVASFDPSQGWP